MPCRWMGWLIMVWLIMRNRTRSPRVTSIGPTSVNFLPLKPQIMRCMLPVNRKTISRVAGRMSTSGRTERRSA